MQTGILLSYDFCVVSFHFRKMEIDIWLEQDKNIGNMLVGEVYKIAKVKALLGNNLLKELIEWCPISFSKAANQITASEKGKQ